MARAPGCGSRTAHPALAGSSANQADVRDAAPSFKRERPGKTCRRLSKILRLPSLRSDADHPAGQAWHTPVLRFRGVEAPVPVSRPGKSGALPGGTVSPLEVRSGVSAATRTLSAGKAARYDAAGNRMHTGARLLSENRIATLTGSPPSLDGTATGSRSGPGEDRGRVRSAAAAGPGPRACIGSHVSG